MIEKETKLYTVGELARRCGVTVRTLQYYDSENLLSPTHYTEGGRRLYNREDVINLQQILFLKSFGFSLEEIRDRMIKTDSSGQIIGNLEKQRAVITRQIEEMRNLEGLLGNVIDEIKLGGYISTEKLVGIISMIKHGSPYSFMLRYFSQKEMKALVNKPEMDNMSKGVAPEWEQLFSRVVALHKRKVDPEGIEGQMLAEEWWSLVRKSTGDDPEMIKTLMDMGDDVDNWPSEAGDFKEAVKEFLSIAMNKYLRAIGVKKQGG